MIETTKEKFGFFCGNCGCLEAGTEPQEYIFSSHGDAICPECGASGEYANYRESEELMQCEGEELMQCEGWSGPCDRKDAVRFHMMTAYVEEEENYRTLCPECQKRSNEYWEEMWKAVWKAVR